MIKLMQINIKYVIAFIVLLITEVIIALFIHDAIIRPYVGDILVVILMYTLIRSFVKSIKLLPLYLFIFAAIVELAQYYRIVYVLQLQDNKIISTIIGTTFSIIDILCYIIATVILVAWERMESYRNSI